MSATPQIFSNFKYQGKINIHADVSNRLHLTKETFSKNASKWQAIEAFYILIGNITDNTPTILDVIDVSSNRRKESVQINIEEFTQVCRKHFVVGTWHTHPSGVVKPSAHDIRTFVTYDVIAGRPLVHIIETDNTTNIFRFNSCYSDPFYQLTKEFELV